MVNVRTRFDESADLIFPLKGTEPCRAAARPAENLDFLNIYLIPKDLPVSPQTGVCVGGSGGRRGGF